ncbi:hypothetical protein [Dictyobacter arantiisoli]|uniref:Uncharacterized protein n=1 Tax=Dictyobacter arantiisoli TaxID=2014874 RepID=A0A5A5TJ38_9CHLR|nr:hypothetical protein [Dictyobacter arantiisoli]GCF11136.1 hypothetical protein KDI_47000 [Dictyobacter arantiisoli]
MFVEPIVECAYGWGQVLRLYPERMEVQGKSYSLSELSNFKPTYRRILGMPSMRLELQFGDKTVIARGIADIALGLKLIGYLHAWSQTAITCTLDEIPAIQKPPAQQLLTERTPRPLVLSPSTAATPQGHFWEYNAHEKPTVSTPSYHGAVDTLQVSRGIVQGENAPASTTLDAVPSWPWTDERHLQHKQRLKLLQAEREIRFYGFAIEALALRLRNEPLPQLSVPVQMIAGECAHYRTEARVNDEPPREGKRVRTRDHGTLILTNLRLIYLGKKRHIILGYEHILQTAQVPGAVVISSEYWERQQFFIMRRPLECAMYLEHILQCFQRTFFPAYLHISGTQQLSWDQKPLEVEPQPQSTRIFH